MCTVILFSGVHPEFPAVVAANRDELYARRARAPEVLPGAPDAIGGVDEARGGSWMGATEHGLFVGITNQRSHRPPDPALRSRGELVLEALRQDSAAAVRELLAELDGRTYNPFNLIFGDARGFAVAYARPGRASIEIEPVPEGVHVVPNDRLDAPDLPKVARVRAAAEPLARLPWERLPPALSALLADHEKPPLEEVPAPPPGSRFSRELARELEAVCIHTPAYGTRSSSVIALEPGRLARYLYADGPPCRAPLEEVLGGPGR